MSRTIFFYLSGLTVFIIGLIAVLHFGAELPTFRPEVAAGHAATATTTGAPAPAFGTASGITKLLQRNLQEPLTRLLLQLIVILAATRAVGGLFRRIGQPPVIGEMLAGILLGPSLLGSISPATLRFLFPPDSLGALRLLSQIGVILFMFVVGLDLQRSHLKNRTHTAILVSHTSIFLSFLLGMLLSLGLYRSLAPSGISFSAFALFMGVAMSMTAFPVMARIIEAKGLSGTFLGNMGIACAAVDDVTAWCVLALVVAVAKAEALSTALFPIVLTVLFIGFMLLVLRPRMGPLLGVRNGEPLPESRIIATILLVILIASCFTEILGIQALYGAFLAGVIVPRDPRLVTFLRERLALFSTVFLLPLFFAFTGLRTQIGLLNTAHSWLIGGVIISVAVMGKMGGSFLAARLSGMTGSQSFALCSLMNTRGLVELIVLNIGYDLGILSPQIFAMMVLMALTTTCMTSPLLSLRTTTDTTKNP